MTPITPVTAVPTDPSDAAAATPTSPSRAPAADFRAVLEAKAAAPDGAALRSPRVRTRETTGEAFEAAMLVPFVAAMLPPEDAEIWGGTGGAMWRGLFADALAGDVARAGGIGIADLVDRMLVARDESSTPEPSKRGDPA